MDLRDPFGPPLIGQHCTLLAPRLWRLIFQSSSAALGVSKYFSKGPYYITVQNSLSILLQSIKGLFKLSVFSFHLINYISFKELPPVVYITLSSLKILILVYLHTAWSFIMVLNVVAALIQSISLLTALPQTTTNGLSDLGTLNAPLLPKFLTDNPLPDGTPWGLRNVTNTDPYSVSTNPSERAPTTNVIREYDFTIRRGFVAPDGVNKSVILINDQFPGPTIEANWGDTIQVKVTNQITGPEEGTALHWHGILQRETPWYDGVPSVQQCPIAPGKSFTYKFKADLYGTSWYHSHYSAQYGGGLLGPMIIHGPIHVPYDHDLGPVLLTDYFHDDYFSLLKKVMGVPAELQYADNNLINGKMNYDCSLAKPGVNCTSNAGISKFKFTSGKTYRLRLINGSAEALLRFSIDNHNMTVMANDFVPIRPYTTDQVTLGVGQRTDIIVKANLPAGSSVFMRSLISSCSLVAPTTQTEALAAIFYNGADETKTPSSNPTLINDTLCGNDPLSKTIPAYPFPATSAPATTEQIDMRIGMNETNHTLWYMSNSSFRANYDHPILLLAKLGNTSYPNDPQWNVYDMGTNSSVRVFVNNTSPTSHPMHLHGHNFNILAEGAGEWDGTIQHIENTQRRDVQVVQPFGYMVFQYNTDNPGVWPFHCHIAWHVSQGMYINLMEQTPKIKNLNIPPEAADTCRDWWAYTGHDVVDQIDSGL